MCKNPAQAKFRIAMSKCLVKSLSKVLTAALKLITSLVWKHFGQFRTIKLFSRQKYFKKTCYVNLQASFLYSKYKFFTPQAEIGDGRVNINFCFNGGDKKFIEIIRYRYIFKHFKLLPFLYVRIEFDLKILFA